MAQLANCPGDVGSLREIGSVGEVSDPPKVSDVVLLSEDIPTYDVCFGPVLSIGDCVGFLNNAMEKKRLCGS